MSENQKGYIHLSFKISKKILFLVLTSVAAVFLSGYLYFNYIKLATIIYATPMNTVGYTEDIQNAEQIIRENGINHIRLITGERHWQGEDIVEKITYLCVCKADGKKAYDALHAKEQQLKGEFYQPFVQSGR